MSDTGLVPNIDWTQLLTVDGTATAKLFAAHPSNVDTKLQVRGYTIPFSGTQQKFVSLMDFLDRQLKAYVFPERDRDANTWRRARDKFGNIPPVRDGKLGEMLLYVCVEAFLGAPLMAYKLRDLSNPNDQVKGADGVFVGTYQGYRALLIGESKIHRKVNSAIKSTMRSLQRFHDAAGPYRNELLIARKYPAERALSPDQLAAVHEVLDGKYDILVHPVFVSYDCTPISEISSKSACSADAEAALASHLQKELDSWKTTVLKQQGQFPRPFQVYLDFFFLPVENSLQLREHFYEMLHGHPFTTDDAGELGQSVGGAGAAT